MIKKSSKIETFAKKILELKFIQNAMKPDKLLQTHKIGWGPDKMASGVIKERDSKRANISLAFKAATNKR